MNDSSQENSASCNDSPFEWLTNFRSLQHLVLPSRIVFGSSPSINSNESLDSSKFYCTERQSPIIQLNALHVGCGTSTVGESLLCMRECTNNHMFQYGTVINVDNDQNALDSLQRRWENRIVPSTTDGGETNHLQEGMRMGSMLWKCLDFSSDHSCRSVLDGAYCNVMENANGDEGVVDIRGGCIDLVLDKSTLDCLLCAETHVVAQFLCEIYRALRVPTASSPRISPSTDSNDEATNRSTTDMPSMSWGGVYVIVTFHPVEFVDRLLTQLPGADWTVEHEIVKREVEDVKAYASCSVDQITSHGSNENDMEKDEAPALSPSTSAWASGTFHPDENYRKTVNVFTCRRHCTPSLSPSVGDTPSYILDKEQVLRHIERTCDEWYQETNPMVTSEREEQIRIAFQEAAGVAGKGSDDRNTALIELKQCYEILFTNAEKEHLAYEYFLEDWDAYCERMSDNNIDVCRDAMAAATALDFLKEMQ